MKHIAISSLMTLIGIAHAETVFTGRDASGVVCELHVERTWRANAGDRRTDFRADVAVTAHDGDKDHGDMLDFTIAFPTQASWQASGSSGWNTLQVDVAASSTLLSRPTGYLVKWRHGNHTHVQDCRGLVAVP